MHLKYAGNARIFIADETHLNKKSKVPFHIPVALNVIKYGCGVQYSTDTSTHILFFAF